MHAPVLELRHRIDQQIDALGSIETPDGADPDRVLRHAQISRGERLGALPGLELDAVRDDANASRLDAETRRGGAANRFGDRDNAVG
jgi:hypothetical protein